MGKVEKTRFERNWTTFVNPAFWYETDLLGKARVLNAIGRLKMMV